jgi:response regulator NasT
MSFPGVREFNVNNNSWRLGSVLIVHQSDETRRVVREALPPDVQVIAECTTCEELAQRYDDVDGGVIVCGVSLDDGDVLEALARLALTRPVPAVVVTHKRSLDIVERAMRDHVMAYLIEPLNPRELLPAMALAMQRADQLEELRQEVEDLQQALADRRVIERAKGALMAMKDLSEQDAYVELRTSAQQRRIRMAKVAREILGESETEMA